jgi:hypothetical protein
MPTMPEGEPWDLLWHVESPASTGLSIVFLVIGSLALSVTCHDQNELTSPKPDWFLPYLNHLEIIERSPVSGTMRSKARARHQSRCGLAEMALILRRIAQGQKLRFRAARHPCVIVRSTPVSRPSKRRPAWL